MLYLYRTCDVGNSGEDFVTDVELAFTSLHEYLLDMIRTDEVVRDILKKK